MKNKIRVLLIGESWMIHTVETKGFDQFSVDSYNTGIEYIEKVLTGEEFSFTHMPCHRISYDFPTSAQALREAYEVVIISDVGSNTFLLPVETFFQCECSVNKLQILRDFVLGGGGVCMAGGYMTFAGIEGKAKYHNSILETVMPVEFSGYDDRQEHPEGLCVNLDPTSHPIFNGVPPRIQGILGYNKAKEKEGCKVLARIEGDPLLTLGKFGQGRTIAYATDIAPHWSSSEFCESPAYAALWKNMVRWLAKEL